MEPGVADVEQRLCQQGGQRVVVVRVDKSRQQGAALQVDGIGLWAGLGGNLLGRPGGENGGAGDRHRIDPIPAGHHGADGAVAEYDRRGEHGTRAAAVGRVGVGAELATSRQRQARGQLVDDE